MSDSGHLERSHTPGTSLEKWSGLLSAAGDVALKEPFTVIATESGLTAAIVRPYDVPIRMGGIRRTRGAGLIVLSVLSSGAMTFEHHKSQWNLPYIGKPDRFDVCGAACVRRVITGDRVINLPFDESFRLDSFQDPALAEPSAILRDYMRFVRTAGIDQDVFRPGNEDARQAAQAVLELHNLISPAANEAFGRPGLRAIGQS